jgi:hypothetical protein
VPDRPGAQQPTRHAPPGRPGGRRGLPPRYGAPNERCRGAHQLFRWLGE